MHRSSQNMCGNVEVAALVGLDRDADCRRIPHTEKLSRAPEKGRPLAGRPLWNPRRLIRSWTFLAVSADLSGPNRTLHPGSVPLSMA